MTTKNGPSVVERMEVADSLYFHEHVARYRFAEGRLNHGWTLDIACGTGYGCEILGLGKHRQVVGIDIYVPSLVQARRLYAAATSRFLAADGTALPFRDRIFANIVTLETVEHIVDDTGYVAELARILRPDGVCVLSTPNRSQSQKEGKINPYHVREYASDELVDLIKRYFAHVELFYQGFSSNYDQQVSQYRRSIQDRKPSLSPVMRFIIDRLYRPLKSVVSPNISYYFVRRLLNISYPQPTYADIDITASPMSNASVLIAVCRQPITSISTRSVQSSGIL